MYQLKKWRGKYCAYWRDPTTKQPQRRSLGTDDEAEAKRLFQSYLKQLEEQRREQGFIINELWEMRRKALEGRRHASNMVWSGKHILPFFGSYYPNQVTEEMCLAYQRQRQGEGKSQGTILTELSHLRSCLTWAVKKNYATRAPHIARPSRPPPRDFHLSKDQARSLLRSDLHPHIRLFVILALATGARNEALLELTWDRVNLVRKLIDLNTSDERMRKARALVPINGMALEALKQAKDLATSDYVIEWKGEPVKSVRNSLKKAATKIGFPFVSPHVFRHSAAVWMAEAGVSMDEIAQFLGHSNPDITRRVYARFSPDYLRKAAGALEL